MAKALENLSDGLMAYSDREAERSLLLSVFSVFDDKVRRSNSGEVLSADGTPMDLHSPAMQAMQKLVLDGPAKHAQAIVSMMKPFCIRFNVDEAVDALKAIDPARRRNEDYNNAITNEQIETLKLEFIARCVEAKELGAEVENLRQMVHDTVKAAEERNLATKSVSMLHVDRLLLSLLNSLRGIWK